ncbi:DUF6105 family protein [Pseudohoeflea coraliihabitans]|uniref:Uncharacterized protein n=1 Tax=Pseudohoeflea coraliihabitans TaxID=2860393 RepID=A0ABS6WU12_9HYPH|nr:DUF6105 family protein [Pseudohoeflea sp. DP4N28-3]MBW3098922.1 hypothetical protein [Pseudohoeflea sp. DP4N28-3]
MKWLLGMWAAPLFLLGSWYGLSYYDISFGTRILSRDLHDLVFAIYGEILGMAPESIPPLVLKAIIIDSLVLFGFVYLRRHRRAIYAWLKATFGRTRTDPDAG